MNNQTDNTIQGRPYEVVFMGCPQFAIPSLNALVNSVDFHVACVYCMPDRPCGRGRKVAMNPVKKFAVEKKIPVRSPASLRNNSEEISYIKGLKPDFIIVVSYGLILPDEILRVPAIAAVNLHPSLLPKYRGSSPIQSAICNMDKVSGICIMLMNSRMDAGDILAVETACISCRDSLQSLQERLSVRGAELMIDTLRRLARREIEPRPQNDSLASYCSKITTESARLDWNKSSKELSALVRAMTPDPGAWFEFDGIRLKTNSVAEGEKTTLPPGSIICADSGKGLCIACGGGTSLLINTVQRPGKAMIASKLFLTGYRKTTDN